MGSERRKFVRVPVKVRMTVKDEEGAGDLYFVSRNLSIGGVFLVSDLLLEQGVKMYLEFSLPPRSALIIVKGEIAWIKDEAEEEVPGGMGVRFLNLDPESKKIITEFIQRRLGESRRSHERS